MFLNYLNCSQALGNSAESSRIRYCGNVELHFLGFESMENLLVQLLKWKINNGGVISSGCVPPGRMLIFLVCKRIGKKAGEK